MPPNSPSPAAQPLDLPSPASKPPAASRRSLLLTGAAGFIGSATVREARKRGYGVVAVDKLTYAGNLSWLDELSGDEGLSFVRADVCDRSVIAELLERHRPTGILHLAAESHVDRSIDGPGEFVRTNIEGTYQLLEAARGYLEGAGRGRPFRFHHVSTDEVFGDLEADEARFHEDSPYRPSSPYSASKAASDHLVRAWARTYGLPAVVTNTSNNYGPRQFPEKLIPRMILAALDGEPLPVYGDGAQVRDWIHVEDHAAGLLDVFERGRDGETYNLGGDAERRNLEVVTTICDLLEELAPERKAPGLARYAELVAHVRDRPGHDRRYAIDASKARRELGWAPKETFESGLRKTVEWYLENEEEVKRLRRGEGRRRSREDGRSKMGDGFE